MIGKVMSRCEPVTYRVIIPSTAFTFETKHARTALVACTVGEVRHRVGHADVVEDVARLRRSLAGVASAADDTS